MIELDGQEEELPDVLDKSIGVPLHCSYIAMSEGDENAIAG